MGRLLTSRLLLTGDLVFSTPLAIAGARGGVSVDLVVARDGAGVPYVPGTSITGALRSYFAQHGDDAFWGATGESEFGASLLRVEDALAKETPDDIEIRDGVAIDRETGAASAGLKYNREVVPAGCTFTFRLSADVRSEADRAKLLQIVRSVRHALTEGAISFGGASSRGFGQAKLINSTLAEIPLSNAKEFLAYLRSGKVPDVDLATRAGDLLPAPAEMIFSLALKPRGPLMVKSGVDGVSAQAVPLLSKTVDGKRQVIPGASFKGVLRSIAERILRSLGKDSNDLVEALFGRAGAKNAVGNAGRGALSIGDVYASNPVSDARWFEERETGSGALPIDPSTPAYISAQHVAIDRWTGGAANGKLFASVEPWDLDLAPLVIRVSERRLTAAATAKRDAALALLLLTLREFARNCPGIGHGATRGYGQVDVGAVSITGVAGLEVGDGFAITQAPSALDGAWRVYLEGNP